MKRLTGTDLYKIFFRSFFIQGSWNYFALIGLGFCFCLLPVAKRLENKKDKEEFLRRHLTYFNSHPFFASWCLGAVAKLEEEAIQKKWKNDKPITIFKERLVGPLGVIGDRLFWNGIKPVAATFGVITAILYGWIAIPVFLLVYNIPHIYVRYKGLMKGYTKGFDIVSDLSLRHFEKYFKIINFIGIFLTGTLITLAGNWTQKLGIPSLFSFGGAFALTFILLQRQKTISTISFWVIFVIMMLNSSFYIIFQY
jgi:mannose/fructose/N-acetylgalactosamine-specific phosphotransferase system component IID